MIRSHANKRSVVTQGGDLGFAVTRAMALQYPQSCKATHINMAILREPTLGEFPALYAKMKATPLIDAEKAGIGRGNGSKRKALGIQASGYQTADNRLFNGGLSGWTAGVDL